MTANVQGGSATIYQFPARGRFAARASVQQLEREAARLPRVAFGSGWYHDEAIEAERAGSK